MQGRDTHGACEAVQGVVICYVWGFLAGALF
jgi:hypothetical protein